MTREDKQKAIDALKISVPIKALTQEEFNDYIQTLNKVMDWLEQEPTTKNNLGVDAVSRQFMRELGATCIATRDKNNKLIALGALDELPSVTPQDPRKGHWIETKEISTNRRGQIVHEVICSECSGIAYFRSMGNKYIGANLCPNCGTDMREAADDGEKN